MTRDRYDRDWDDNRRYAGERDRGRWDHAGDERGSRRADEEADPRQRQRSFERGGGPSYGRGSRDRFERGASEERYDDYDYGHDADEFRRDRGGGGGNYPGDYYNRGFGRFGRGFGLGQGAGMGPGSATPFGPDYSTDFREIGYGGRGSDVNTRDDIPLYARGHYDRGPHAGRGPAGYQRASERIVEDVNEHLTRHGRIDASHIKVSAEDGEVTLEGTVDSRRAKRMAEDVAEDVPGVRDVHNRLRIDRNIAGNEDSRG